MIKTRTKTDSLLYIEVEEDLKMENAREFYEDVKAAMPPEVNHVIIGFSDVRFVDSSGVGILIKLSEEMKTAGVELVISGLNKSLTSVFKLSGLLSVLEVFEESELKSRFPEIGH